MLRAQVTAWSERRSQVVRLQGGYEPLPSGLACGLKPDSYRPQGAQLRAAPKAAWTA